MKAGFPKRVLDALKRADYELSCVHGLYAVDKKEFLSRADLAVHVDTTKTHEELSAVIKELESSERGARMEIRIHDYQAGVGVEVKSDGLSCSYLLLAEDAKRAAERMLEVVALQEERGLKRACIH